MRSAKYIDLIKDKYNLKSDTQAAKMLKIDQLTLYRYRSGKSIFSDETSVKVARLLDMNAALVIADIRGAGNKDQVLLYI